MPPYSWGTLREVCVRIPHDHEAAHESLASFSTRRLSTNLSLTVPSPRKKKRLFFAGRVQQLSCSTFQVQFFCALFLEVFKLKVHFFLVIFFLFFSQNVDAFHAFYALCSHFTQVKACEEQVSTRADTEPMINTALGVTSSNQDDIYFLRYDTNKSVFLVDLLETVVAFSNPVNMTVICKLGSLARFVILLSLTSSSHALIDNCSSHSQCPDDSTCCGNSCSRDFFCLGQSCYFNSDCGIYGSCCTRGKIDKLGRKCRVNCTFEYCSEDGDCGRQETCQRNECILDKRAGAPHNRSSGDHDDVEVRDKLQTQSKETGSWYFVSVIGIIIFVILLATCLCFTLWFSKRAHTHSRSRSKQSSFYTTTFHITEGILWLLQLKLLALININNNNKRRRHCSLLNCLDDRNQNIKIGWGEPSAIYTAMTLYVDLWQTPYEIWKFNPSYKV